MKILHTADWQLGMRAGQAGDRAEAVRAERLRAVERLVALALELQVDAVLVAGDVFERQDVDENVLIAAIEQLNLLAPIPVALLPGNHDPYVVGGVWTRGAWKSVGDHVMVATEAAEVELADGLVIYPCPLSQKQSRQDPTAWIPARRDGDRRLRVGLAHGALDSLSVASNFPIARDRAEVCGLDYLALGDWHGVSIQGRAAYPGTPEQTSYSERLPGYVLVVELSPEQLSPEQSSDQRGEPSIEQHRIGRFVWLQLREDLRDETDLQKLQDQVRTAARPEDLLLRLELRIASTDSHLAGLIADFRADLESRLFFLEWRQSEGVLETDDPLPPGLLQEADEALQVALSGTMAEGIAEGMPEALLDAPEAVLQEARSQLQHLAALATTESS